ncbi:sugar kinase [uncultured Amnibacterium sp.]|uniref:sugar kinase n=1 Tax=uncultured Amnibacterium sp. TaxID=1631851 RepID=UPI0035CBAB3D
MTTDPVATAPPESRGVVTLGETLALFAASGPGSLRSGAEFDFRIGGAESNVAIGLSRLGVPVAWFGRVGTDSFGDEIVRSLRGEGVEVHAVRDPLLRTGVMVKERRTPLHQQVSYYRAGSAGSALSAADIDDAVLAAAGVLHVTGITPALSASAAAAVNHAIAVARAAGVLVSMDVNYRAGLWSITEASERLGRLLPQVDLLFAGPEEAELFVDADPDLEVLAGSIAALGPREVVIKNGAAGATAFVDGEYRSATPPQVPVVDTVGAGDAFVAGYLTALLEGKSTEHRLEFACIAGAFACMATGDWEGAASRADLELLALADPVLR